MVTAGTQVLDRNTADARSMSENNDPSPDVPESPETSRAAPAAYEPDAPAKRTFRARLAGAGSRLRGTRGLIAATLAALIVGGFGGAAIHAAADGGGRDHGRFPDGFHPGEMGHDFGGRMADGERPGGPGDAGR